MLRVSDRAAVISSAALYATLQPYYVRLYNSNGAAYYSGYNRGAVDLWDSAQGSGNGWFGSGASAIDVLADWWFYFTPNTDRSYGYTISCPLHGFFICYADDGFWDSKEAHVRLDLSAMGYQYNAKPTTSVNVFDYDGQNTNLNSRYDNAPRFRSRLRTDGSTRPRSSPTTNAFERRLSSARNASSSSAGYRT